MGAFLFLAQAATLGATNYTVDTVMPVPVHAPAFADEFEGREIDRAKWRFDTSRNALGWFNNERQYYSAFRRKNARIENGALVIEPPPETLPKARFPDWGGRHILPQGSSPVRRSATASTRFAPSCRADGAPGLQSGCCRRMANGRTQARST